MSKDLVLARMKPEVHRMVWWFAVARIATQMVPIITWVKDQFVAIADAVTSAAGQLIEVTHQAQKPHRRGVDAQKTPYGPQRTRRVRK